MYNRLKVFILQKKSIKLWSKGLKKRHFFPEVPYFLIMSAHKKSTFKESKIQMKKLILLLLLPQRKEQEQQKISKAKDDSDYLAFKETAWS